MKRLIWAAAIGIGFSALPAQNRWETYKFPSGNFSISAPVKPQARDSNAKVRIYSFVAVTKEDTYSVTFSDDNRFDDVSRIGAILDGARNGALANAKGTLLEEKGMTLAGHPGKYIKFSTASGLIARENIILVRSRLYQVLVVSTKERIGGADATRFLNSFKLLNN